MKKMTIKEKIEFLKALEETIEYVDRQIDCYTPREYDEYGNEIGPRIPTIEEDGEYSYYEYVSFTKLKEELEKLTE